MQQTRTLLRTRTLRAYQPQFEVLWFLADLGFILDNRVARPFELLPRDPSQVKPS
jgi:hypothetical protein